MASSKNQDIHLPECMMCGQVMSFDGKEDAEPGFEIQSFECRRCHSVGQLMAVACPKPNSRKNAA
jgi:hypothetical protein